MNSEAFNELLCLMYVKRRRTILFHDWKSAMLNQPFDVWLDAQRIISELFPHAVNCCDANTFDQSFTFINHYFQHQVQAPLVCFTPLEPASIRTYLQLLISRDTVRQLLVHQNCMSNPQQLQLLIDQLGGVDFSYWWHNPSFQALHLFFLHALWMNRDHTRDILCLCIDKQRRQCASVLIDNVGCTKKLFQCVRMHDSGAVCGKEAAVRCERCHRAFYCSAQCQRQDKVMHQLECIQKKCCLCKRTVRT